MHQRTSAALTLANLLLVPLLAGYAVTPDPAVPLVPPGLTMEGKALHVRPDLAFATDFVKLLMDHGVKVRSLSHSLYNGFFEDAHQAAHLATPDGAIEVVVFPYEVAGKVKVARTYDIEGGVFLFDVQRHPGPDGTTTIDSPCPLAVMMAGRWFILTDSEKLAKLIKGLTHPVLATDRPAT